MAHYNTLLWEYKLKELFSRGGAEGAEEDDLIFPAQPAFAWLYLIALEQLPLQSQALPGVPRLREAVFSAWTRFGAKDGLL